MTRRLSVILLFLLLAGLLAPAHFASGATTSYYGLSFNRSGYISTTTTESFSQGLTIVALVRFEGIPNDTAGYDWMAIATKKAYTNDWGFLQEVKSTSRQLALFVNGTRVVSAQDSVENGRTYLLAASYDGSMAKLYFNGNLLASNSIDMQIPDNYNDILIGNSSGRYLFGGEIYLVLIYNRALSDAEIQQIYQDPLHPPTSGLVLEYLPSSVDPSTNTWKDLSGNGNDGQINGATYVPLRPLSESTPSASAPVALSFDGENDYVEVPYSDSINLTEEATIIALYFFTGTSRGISTNKEYCYRVFDYYPSSNTYRWLVGNGTGWLFVDAFTPSVTISNNWVFVADVIDWKDGWAKLYLNGKLERSKTFTAGSITGNSQPLYIGTWSPYGFFLNGSTPFVLIYARALNSSEIAQIYENPNNPPLDGLVLWYSPYTYDPSTGKWLNRAPIFPTIPLVEELDGVNYGATAERVSIPSAAYYDASNSSPISPLDVSVSMLANNTTIGLIPSFLTLPYNITVTLNVSAAGYKNRTLSILAAINSLAVYLEPTQSHTTTNPIQPPTETISSAFKISSNYNDQGLWGGRLGIYFLTGNWSEGFRRFWTLNPMFELVLPVIFAFGIILSSYLVTRKPLVPVGTTAVMATFFGMLGIPLQLSIATPLAALFIFWIVYILWGFYKRFERS